MDILSAPVFLYVGPWTLTMTLCMQIVTVPDVQDAFNTAGGWIVHDIETRSKDIKTRVLTKPHQSATIEAVFTK